MITVKVERSGTPLNEVPRAAAFRQAERSAFSTLADRMTVEARNLLATSPLAAVHRIRSQPPLIDDGAGRIVLIEESKQTRVAIKKKATMADSVFKGLWPLQQAARNAQTYATQLALDAVRQYIK